MTREDLLRFLRAHRMAVEASVSGALEPQAAVVGIAVTEACEIVFDTVDTTRKVANLRRRPKVAFVIGGVAAGEERTVQYEGIADEPKGADLARLKEIYFATFPDGRDRLAWPGLVYVRVRPTWVRYSDFETRPPRIFEFTAADLAR